MECSCFCSFITRNPSHGRNKEWLWPSLVGIELLKAELFHKQVWGLYFLISVLSHFYLSPTWYRAHGNVWAAFIRICLGVYLWLCQSLGSPGLWLWGSQEEEASPLPLWALPLAREPVQQGEGMSPHRNASWQSSVKYFRGKEIHLLPGQGKENSGEPPGLSPHGHSVPGMLFLWGASPAEWLVGMEHCSQWSGWPRLVSSADLGTDSHLDSLKPLFLLLHLNTSRLKFQAIYGLIATWFLPALFGSRNCFIGTPFGFLNEAGSFSRVLLFIPLYGWYRALRTP